MTRAGLPLSTFGMRRLVLISPLTVAGSAVAGEFRTLTPIGSGAKAPQGATPEAEVRPVEKGATDAAVRTLIDGWNNGELDQHLAEEFVDASRLTDQMQVGVPRDARLRLLSVHPMQATLSVCGEAAINFAHLYTWKIWWRHLSDLYRLMSRAYIFFHLQIVFLFVIFLSP